MNSTAFQRQQAATGLEQLAALARAQSWRGDGVPSLPPTQSAVLRLLGAAPAAQRARQMAQRLGLSAASLSDSLKALEGKGWISRRADPEDARASLVELTVEGTALARRLLSASGGLGALMKKLGPEDLGAFLRVTQLLVQEAQQQGLATGPRTCLGCRYFQPYVQAGDKPHFCGLVRQPFGDPELRVDCAEQEPADPKYAAASLRRFRRS